MQLLYVYTFLQIIFEALPVSSSGNLLLWIPLLQNLLHLDDVQSTLPEFDFLLHIPTFFILSVFFFKRWWPYARNFYFYKKELWHLALHYAVADGVTLGLYYFWKFFGVSFFPLAGGFLCTTALLFSLRLAKPSGREKPLSFLDAAVLGFAQGCALLPGISRLAATFVTAVWLGYGYPQAFHTSFLLQIPLVGAALVKSLWEVYQQGGDPLLCDITFYGVVVIASVIAFCFLRVLSGMVQRKSVWKFAWYTGVLSLLAAFCGF